ncbi:MAG: NnrS family protein [Azospirillum sp.]|nr:NnrS family protein [Azospirillum sp.]
MRSAQVFSYGFRCFFLLAGAQAALAVPVWLGVLWGVVPAPGWSSAVLWHGHEMVFGYAVAVIAGFLLTAVPNWTGTDRLHGPVLAGLAGLWLAGRLAVSLDLGLPPAVIAAVDLSFLPCLAVRLALLLIETARRRNYAFIVLLGAMFLANLVIHLEGLGWLQGYARPAVTLAVFAIAMMISVMAGRVIPLFTGNALKARGVTAPPVVRPWLEWAATPALLAAGLATAFAEDSTAVVVGSLLAAALHGLRLAGWQSRHTLDQPIVWILHAGYAWLVVGLALAGLAPLGAVIPPSAALHALTAGAIGVLTLGMMTRVARGHTGRPLAVDRWTVAAYGLVNAAAAIRVFGPIVLPKVYGAALVGSGALWSLGFLLFTLVHWPILSGPRVDGRPG